MTLEELKLAKSIVVGTRQTTKAVENGLALAVYFARDAEEKVIAPVLEACQRNGIQVIWSDTMNHLGKACNIKVGAAMAALLQK